MSSTANSSEPGGNDAGNHHHHPQQLARAEHAYVADVMRQAGIPLENLRWNPGDGSLDSHGISIHPDANTVTELSTGRRLSRASFNQILSRLDPGRSGVGEATLSRALVTQAALEGQVPRGSSLRYLGHAPADLGRENTGGESAAVFRLLRPERPLFYSQPGTAGADNRHSSGTRLADHFASTARNPGATASPGLSSGTVPNAGTEAGAGSGTWDSTRLALTEQTRQTLDHLNTAVPGLVHERTRIYSSVEDLLNSDYARNRGFSQDTLDALHTAEGFYDSTTGQTIVIAGNVELRLGETPHDALTPSSSEWPRPCTPAFHQRIW